MSKTWPWIFNISNFKKISIYGLIWYNINLCFKEHPSNTPWIRLCTGFRGNIAVYWLNRICFSSPSCVFQSFKSVALIEFVWSHPAYILVCERWGILRSFWGSCAREIWHTEFQKKSLSGKSWGSGNTWWYWLPEFSRRTMAFLCKTFSPALCSFFPSNFCFDSSLE